MQQTPDFSTSSAFWKASANVVFSLAMRNRFWLGMTISVSTCSARLTMPSLAMRIRRWPSNSNGLVTTPTVRMPISLAARAITGAAPVPVPPPMPAVMNSMWLPSTSERSSSIASSAAAAPISGREPAPRPSVMVTPICTRQPGRRHRQRLRIGVRGDEFDALEPVLDHVVDGIAARAANADDGDPRPQFGQSRKFQIDAHGSLVDITPAFLGLYPPACEFRVSTQKLSRNHCPTRAR